jgi:hypothetical protein
LENFKKILTLYQNSNSKYLKNILDVDSLFETFLMENIQENYLLIRKIKFSSINFAINIIYKEKPDEGGQDYLRIFQYYFEFPHLIFKFNFYKNRSLENYEMFTNIDEENWKNNIFPKIEQSFKNFEMLINEDDIIYQDGDFKNKKDNAKIPKEIKFSNSVMAVYHYLKHSLEQTFEMKIQLNNLALISPSIYLQEANQVINSRISEKLDLNDYQIFYYSYNEDGFYKSHNRLVFIKTKPTKSLVSYFKLL